MTLLRFNRDRTSKTLNLSFVRFFEQSEFQNHVNMTIQYIYFTFLFDDASFNTSIYVHYNSQIN